MISNLPEGSHLLYSVELYANTGITHLSKLITLNNKILQILQNKAYNAPVKELYTAYTTLPIPQLHKQQMLLLAHKYYYHKHLLPKIFCDYFQFNQGIIVMKLGTKLVFIYAV